MRRPLALLLGLVVVAAAVTAVVTPAAAHGNHLSVDAQVSSDGTIVVESMFMTNPGHLVVHQDRDGSIGPPLGHASVSQGFHSDFEVAVDDEYWADQNGTRTYWLVLHRDDGDGEFEPGSDTPIQGIAGQYAGQQVTVGKSADGAVRVVTGGFTTQRVDSAAVTVRGVDLDRPGYVALRNVTDDGTTGEVVGTKRLDAGSHDNVSVAVSESFFGSLATGETAELEAILHAADGDGEFTVDGDQPIRVGEETVSSRFDVKKVQNAQATTQPLINTPEPTTTGATTGQSSATATGPTAETGGAGGDSQSAVPGFTGIATVVALVAGALVWRRRD
ncbi:DUF7282 domain-containing protein [Haloarchaeobius amylolyticus]|uniref:DUF7282 domain-containing protein n=1 Tax=Haloarchaeobius amylolyticus TaxID=1198296 RepID=UPI00226DA073|nr:hypothetical protein [Haloarchaeobius amylolyticus]